MNYHLVILKKPYLDLILAGEKTIELRLTRAKRPAGGRVLAQDRLFLKQSGGPVCGLATAQNVEYYDGPDAGTDQADPTAVQRPDPGRRRRLGEHDGPPIRLSGVAELTCGGSTPIRIVKQDWRAWVVLTREKDFGLLKGQD